jgi:hypothetical protein
MIDSMDKLICKLLMSAAGPSEQCTFRRKPTPALCQPQGRQR